MQKATAPNAPASWASRQYSATNHHQREGDGVRGAEQPKRRVQHHCHEVAAVRDHELTDMGDGEQAAGNHSDRSGMGTERRFGHENLTMKKSAL
jgi:hypothetical protein